MKRIKLFLSRVSPVRRDEGALHLLLGDDVPDTGQPVGQQEEAHHQEDQDEAAVLRVPSSTLEVSQKFYLLTHLSTLETSLASLRSRVSFKR